MATRTAAEFDVDGHEVLGAHGSANGHQVFITRPFQMPRLGWLKHQPRAAGQERDSSARWLRNAMIALGVLAATAAIVSYAAQYKFILTAKSSTAIAALEAGIPDAAAVIFACLGIALALQGKRAVRARVLNVGAVATSIFMNFAAAAGTGWRDVAIWTMPPVAYALASDTAIGVVRAWVVARQKALSEALADNEPSPLAMLGRVVLYTMRLIVAPPSTARGARRSLLNATPLPSALTASAAQDAIECAHADTQDVWAETAQVRETAAAEALAGGAERDLAQGCSAGASAVNPETRPRRRRPQRQGETKTAAFLRLVAETHGPLAGFPLVNVSRVAGELAPKVGLHSGTARRALKIAVVAETDKALGGAA